MSPLGKKMDETCTACPKSESFKSPAVVARACAQGLKKSEVSIKICAPFIFAQAVMMENVSGLWKRHGKVARSAINRLREGGYATRPRQRSAESNNI